MEQNNLNKCINLLANVYAKTYNNDAREMLLEIGTLLKKEINTTHKLDPQKLYEDNILLTKEINSIKQSCIKLTEILNQKIPSLINQMEQIKNNINELKL